MKELSIEEKAKAYDEALEKARLVLQERGNETDEWKEGNIIRRGGILALVIKGRRVMKSNGEIFTVQYPDEWVKAVPNEIEHFLNELEKQGKHPIEEIEDTSVRKYMELDKFALANMIL